MPRPASIRLLTLVTAGALALAGCSGGSAGEPTTPPAASETNTSETATSETGAASETVPDDVVDAQDLPNEPVGSEITVAGEPATVCIYGDGYGTSVWAAGGTTSCELVEATYAAATEGHDVDQVLRDVLGARLTVTDPASGAEHVLTCAQRGDTLTSCVGDDVVVHIY
ncbi:hypothetical protein IF650_01155 [Cellulosimicrobium terreum]|nr:hypothetical protein [Cellulosimicrobium terreum]